MNGLTPFAVVVVIVGFSCRFVVGVEAPCSKLQAGTPFDRRMLLRQLAREVVQSGV
ncbi:hypothetical protein BC830DRAFT_1176032 [Chytriomyces sp. MP71]|nr:hypothetical protein BC830DRAFT_1176032 [Chytriomyces sp. MP71]